ncbi:hypothetical protein CC80DRAFT_491879 [Byssothecium circinans]|uniref:Uncharacterized protein n=1 Tax=Byssothecium circinans TaxID=147558 RepID=A0A6A5TZ90_9PLEO|nr:hypothetical protein CC80DRAFT_491879 [Byssothecium circinans]
MVDRPVIGLEPHVQGPACSRSMPPRPSCDHPIAASLLYPPRPRVGALDRVTQLQPSASTTPPSQHPLTRARLPTR